ncbi:MAG: hypothetical protein ABI700_32080 [Chloroflexota bacterium]
MTWALVIIFIVIVVIMSLNNAGRIPWGDKMRRLNAGSVQKVEWMAPDHVVAQVRAQYLEAINWLHESMLTSWAKQWSTAPNFLSGTHLKRYHNSLLLQRDGKGVEVSGVLRADHVVEVRQFSETGAFCLVIDHQSQRRMATYNRKTFERLHTQDLGDGVVVYAMLYDAKDQRWKIGSFVQELPTDWRTRPLIQELSTMPGAIGRDY